MLNLKTTTVKNAIIVVYKYDWEIEEQESTFDDSVYEQLRTIPGGWNQQRKNQNLR